MSKLASQIVTPCPIEAAKRVHATKAKRRIIGAVVMVFALLATNFFVFDQTPPNQLIHNKVGSQND